MKHSALRFHRAMACVMLLHSEAAISLLYKDGPLAGPHAQVPELFQEHLSSFLLVYMAKASWGRTKKDFLSYVSGSCSGPQQRTACLLRIRSGKSSLIIKTIVHHFSIDLLGCCYACSVICMGKGGRSRWKGSRKPGFIRIHHHFLHPAIYTTSIDQNHIFQ